jgi:hypothetical protein
MPKKMPNLLRLVQYLSEKRETTCLNWHLPSTPLEPTKLVQKWDVAHINHWFIQAQLK